VTLSIVATAGSASANSYITLAEAEAYVETLCFSEAWTGKTDPQKNAAIVSATRLLDTLRWVGMRSAQDQALAWPRMAPWTVDPFIRANLSPGVGDLLMLMDGDGYYVPTDEIPVKVKNATCELALRLLGEDRTADAGALAPSRVKIGSLEIEGIKAQRIPAFVRSMVKEFLSPVGLEGVRG